MKLNPSEAFDIKAEAYRILTGWMAPGKDVSPHSPMSHQSYRDRLVAWDDWITKNGAIARAFVMAIETVLPDRDDDE